MIGKSFGLEARTLSDEQWCAAYAEYKYLKKLEHQIIKGAVLEAAAEIIKHLSSKRWEQL